MYSRIREHFGPTALILSIVAIVFAMLGGAYAASSNGGNATASAKGKQGPPGPRGKTGKTGKTGAPGVAGPVGPQGPAGANGKDGSNGQNGSPGAPGKDGKSVEVNPAGITNCEELGGILVKVEGEAGEGEEVCNGAKGEKGDKGDEGSPWTAGGTLPPEKTETGTWAFNAASGDGANILVPISFPIPLPSLLLGAESVHFQGATEEEREKEEEGEETEFTESCKVSGVGNVLNPKAKPGQFCIYNNYEGEPENALVKATFTAALLPSTNTEPAGVGRSGALLKFAFSGAPGEVASGFGSWAVTAPAP